MTGTPIGEVAEFMRHVTHPHWPHHHGTPQPAAAATPQAVPHNGTQEATPMSLTADLHAIATRLEGIGEEGVAMLERVQANPETATAFSLLDAVTKLPISEGVLTTAIEVLKLTLGQAGASAQAALNVPAGPQATGPVIAGQA
jgi:hypothetical protein